MIGDPQQTFAAMLPAERMNLAKLSRWLAPDYTRKRDEHLLGPEYEALHKRGVIDTEPGSYAAGKVIQITDLGRAVLGYMAGDAS